MNALKTYIPIMLAIVWTSCNSGSTENKNDHSNIASRTVPKTISDKGIGEIKHVELDDNIDGSMVKKGKAIYDMKCAACHRLDSKRVVGPGFHGVTDRRRPEWIMNLITNVDVMLDNDPVAQELLEQCLTRMPNQNVSVGDARDILEFMRKNDQVIADAKK